MNWALEAEQEQQWKRVAGTNFPGGHLLNQQGEFSFSVARPTGATTNRVRIQYGLGMYGMQLWRERARRAWKTGRLAAAFHFNEWEAGETIAALSR